MSERLEEIKSRVWRERCTYAVGDDSSREGYRYILSDEDYQWLLEQAERVELLERENKALNDMLTTLEKQDIIKLLDQNVRLIKQNNRYREAIEKAIDTLENECL